MADNKKKKYGEALKNIWKKKYESQVDFTTTEESVSRRSLNYIQSGNIDSKRSTIKRIAIKMEMPAFILHGILDGEIELDEYNNWIVKKTGQLIKHYKP